ncbi:MAG TPA: adenosylcobinamide-GDP ribazoletransferase [Methanomassiliicoccales archaeon]|nr:adenosylcobinamide-GDP ribazoletransferase [Methanomassiliicoccales archaeon]
MFTVLPAKVDGKDVDDLSRRFYLIVFIGALYGVLAAGIFYLGQELLPTIVLAAAVLAVFHLLNRFLHLDGLSDFGDGMVCGGDAERRMAAMKDSKTGAGGVGYAVVFTILSFAALASLTGQAELLFFPLIAEIMNKNAMVFCAYGGKAREGLGNSFVSNTKGKQALLSLVLSVLLAFGAILLVCLPTGYWHVDKIALFTVAGGLVSAIVGLLVGRVAMKNFGAVNGDVMGATNEISRPVVLIAMLLLVAL